MTASFVTRTPVVAQESTQDAPGRAAIPIPKLLGTQQKPSGPTSSGHESRFLPKLRPYQEECVQTCLDAIAAGTLRLGVSSPTGTGKTTMFTELLRRIPERNPGARQVLILVNSVALALQACTTVQRGLPSLVVELEQGTKYVASGHADVTVATVQSLRSSDRLSKYDPTRFKCVIVDEAHHAAAPSYLQILSRFNSDIEKMPGCGDGNMDEEIEALIGSANGTQPPSQVPVIGFSATFSRHDGVALGNVFDQIVFHRDFLDMIQEKWLAPLRFTAVQADLDLSHVASSGGDYVTTSLARVVNQPPVNELLVRIWLDRAWRKRRSTLVFAVNIDHVEALVAEFRSRGVDARALHSGIPARERVAVLDEFHAGKFPVLVNCAILTEGADVPPIDCVLLARPTKSRNLFSQMIGRGVRPSPKTGKENCLVLDLVGNLQHGVVCTPTLFGLNNAEGIDEETMDALQERGRQQEEMSAAQTAADPDNAPWLESVPDKLTYVDYDSPTELLRAMRGRSRGSLWQLSPNAWVDCGAQRYVLTSADGSFIRVEKSTAKDVPQWCATYTQRNPDHAWAWEGERPTAARAPYYKKRVILRSDDLGHALRGCDTFLGRALTGAGKSPMYLRRNAPWRFQPASPKARSMVEGHLLRADDSRRSRAALDDAQRRLGRLTRARRPG